MTVRLIRITVVAVALLLAALLVPGIVIDWADDGRGIAFMLLGLALAFGLVNAVIRPVARLVRVPLNLVTFGLFSVVLKAALLLSVAFLVDLVAGPLLVVGGFPPELGIEALSAAAMGSFVISAVSTGLTMLIPEA